MMRTCKIVFIGAGSASFGRGFFMDVFHSNELCGSEMWLVDIDGERLERMFRLACVMNEAAGGKMILHKTLERKEALPGADFVVNSIAIDRLGLWKYDYTVPREFGLRHSLGENGGPGALFFTLRTIPVLIEIARDMEKFCPDALFINFSNPESRIIYALANYTKIKCVGLCHGIFIVADNLGKMINRSGSELSVSAAGINHFQWVYGVRDAKTGQDLLPAIIEAEKTYDPLKQPFSRKLLKHFGMYPSCDDGHVSEYLAYGYEAGESGYDFEGDERGRVKQINEIEDCINGVIDPKTWLHPSGEQGVNVITAVLHNKGSYIPSGILKNNGAIPNLPDDAAAEVPFVADAHGIHNVACPPLPEGIAALCSAQIYIQRLSTAAAAGADKSLAMQALLCDPVVNSTEGAEKTLEKLWNINLPNIKKVI